MDAERKRQKSLDSLGGLRAKSAPDAVPKLSDVIGNQALLQRMAGQPILSGSSKNGIPADLKAKVERKSGLALDSVNVHYRSPLPAGVGALAYTKGTDVYIGPGQERHLAHELGHVVQQMQGRVKPTGKVAGQPLNDDSSLEREADSYR